MTSNSPMTSTTAAIVAAMRPGADRIAAAMQQLATPPAAPGPTAPAHDNTAHMEAHLMESRLAFGNLLAAWQRRNGWSQEAPARIAIAAGFDGFDVHNSQWSQVSSGKLTPKPKFFAAIAVLNGLVADTTWAKPGTSRQVLNDLRDAAPLQQHDGTPWGPADFFAAYIGA